MKEKIIYTAIAAPGAGKSETFINKLPEYLDRNDRVVLALPTHDLCSDIAERLKKIKIHPKIATSKTTESKSVTKSIEGILRSESDNLIIITHDGLRRIDPKSLQNYILVIDEVPGILEFMCKSLTPEQSNRIFDVTTENGGKLSIKRGLKTKIRSQIENYQNSKINSQVGSTLSELEHSVFSAILTDNLVYIDKEKDKNRIRIITEKMIFKHIDYSKETHLLAANINGTFFDLFAKHFNYQYKESAFTPKQFEYKCEIKIFTLMENWSKSKALEDINGAKLQEHKGQYKHQNIDRALYAATQKCFGKKTIIIRNKWAKFDLKKDYQAFKIDPCNVDCRGLNIFTNHTAAIILFSGQPSPYDVRSLQSLSIKYSIPLKSFKDAWITTNKLESTLQAATRTAVRNRNNTEPIYLFVQDLPTAEYLKSTYMKNAEIDRSLEIKPAEKKDGRSKFTPSEKQIKQEYIESARKAGIPDKTIRKELQRKWGCSASTAWRITQPKAA